MLRITLNLSAMIAAGAVIQTNRDHKTQIDSKEVHFRNLVLRLPKDEELYICLGEINDSPHHDLKEFVTEVSCYDNFGEGLSPRRQIGGYRLASATATVETTMGSHPHYHVKLRAKKLEDLRELSRLIRLGQTWPDDDYGAEQVPPPFRHIRQLINEIWELARRDVKEKLYRIKERSYY